MLTPMDHQLIALLIFALVVCFGIYIIRSMPWPFPAAGQPAGPFPIQSIVLFVFCLAALIYLCVHFLPGLLG